HASPPEAEAIRGAVDEARDSLASATAHYAHALELARATDPALLPAAFEGLQRMYGQQGRTDLSLDLANRMLQVDPQHRALYLYDRGVAYSGLNDSIASKEAFDEALRLAVAAGDLSLVAKVHRQMGLWIWRYQRDVGRALHEYDVALASAERAGDQRTRVFVLVNFGNVLRNSEVGRFAEALAYYDEALATARREHLSFQVAYILRDIGDVYRQQHDQARAEAVLQEALELADRANVRDVRWYARAEFGALLRDRDPVRAERYLREAIDIVEAENSDVLLEDFRPGVLADSVRFLNPYDDLIGFLVARGRGGEAFLIAERQRARAFLETLSANRDALARDVPPSFTRTERAILDRIKTAQSALRGDGLTEAKRAEMLATITRNESDLSDARLQLAVEHPEIAAARFPKLWSLADVQSRLLRADEAMLAFYAGASQSVAWVVRRDRATTLLLPPAKVIQRSVREAIDALRNPAPHDDARVSAASRVLRIGAIANAAGTSRLLIIPHGVLHDLPFEALVDDGGHRLVERFAISYAPSASSLAFLRSLPQRPAAGMTLVAIANPVVAPAAVAKLRQADLAHINLLAPLPQTSSEARDIANPFGASARVLDGSRATLSELRAAANARILHFATHGLIDESRPERSGLVLTADPPHDDGLLQVRDIYSLRLNADLVTLSACETALGKNVTGEGILGLTRAFFFAGARSVVASLWDVDDAATARFMDRFYANLRRGDPIDVALQGAKLAFLRRGGVTSAPFFWASFVVSGNARAAIAAPPQSDRGFAAILLVGIAVGGYFAIVRLRGADTATGRP
ncbi:MAG TPA: CHAT domain-containing tetratricopeptide repeat protein, partial [Thermoanaerobaculia bacterium]|nr:CHAT domain-containing tetratricopeptide repeat protein [Thermoanaerobaculia bacterium]